MQGSGECRHACQMQQVRSEMKWWIVIPMKTKNEIFGGSLAWEVCLAQIDDRLWNDKMFMSFDGRVAGLLKSRGSEREKRTSSLPAITRRGGQLMMLLKE